MSETLHLKLFKILDLKFEFYKNQQKHDSDVQNIEFDAAPIRRGRCRFILRRSTALLVWFTHWAAGAGAITHRFIIVVDTAKNTRFFGGSCHASTSDVDALLRFVGKDRVCNAAAFFNVDVLIWFFYFLLFFLQTITVSYRNDRNGHAKYQEELDRRCHLLKEVVGKFETLNFLNVNWMWLNDRRYKNEFYFQKI